MLLAPVGEDRTSTDPTLLPVVGALTVFLLISADGKAAGCRTSPPVPWTRMVVLILRPELDAMQQKGQWLVADGFGSADPQYAAWLVDLWKQK